MKQFSVDVEEDIRPVCEHVIERINDCPIVLMYGDLGAGKTTTVKHLLSMLKSDDQVSSPSFSLINEYESPSGVIYHMDMYRIETLEEAINIGIEEYLDSGNICLIEWPQIVEDLIVDNFLKIIITVDDENKRTITVE